MQLARSRGALSGLLLVILGIWGGLVPFVGPLFGYAYTPDTSWYFSSGRFWLEILPALAVIIGGMLLLLATHRVIALFGAILAAVGGAWFVLGPFLSQLWNGGEPAAGTPASTTTGLAVAEQIGFFYGLGVLVLIIASVALGRMSLVGLRDLRVIEAERDSTRTADTVDVRTVVVHDEPGPQPAEQRRDYSTENYSAEDRTTQPYPGESRTEPYPGARTEEAAAVPNDDAPRVPSHRRVDETSRRGPSV